MSDESFSSEFFPYPSSQADNATSLQSMNKALGYAVGLGLVATAAVIAFLVETLAPTTNLALVFVIPVLVAAVGFGWGPGLASAVASVLAFDFFFVPPLFTLRVTSPADVWALVLFLAVAAIASAVADLSRRRAIEARRAALRAEALHGLAYLVVDAAPETSVIEAAGVALSRIFRAPAVVLLNEGGHLRPAAVVAGAALSDHDQEAAEWVLSNHLPTHADAFPFEKSRFDFWPIQRGDGPGIVFGIGMTASHDDRPAEAQRYVELVGAYLAASLSRGAEPAEASRVRPRPA